MGMGRAVAHNPKDGIGGVDKKKLTLLVEQAELMVGEEIAEETVSASKRAWVGGRERGLRVRSEMGID